MKISNYKKYNNEGIFEYERKIIRIIAGGREEKILKRCIGEQLLFFLHNIKIKKRRRESTDGWKCGHDEGKRKGYFTKNKSRKNTSTSHSHNTKHTSVTQHNIVLS